MVEVTTNEQQVKQDQLFLKIEDGAVVHLRSNLVHIMRHYFPNNQPKFVLCLGKECKICEAGKNQRKHAYFYFGSVNGDEGIIQLPPSCFFDMNEVERLTKTEKRDFEWVIGKSGTGQQTKYATIKGEKIDHMTDEQVAANNERLVKIISKIEFKMREAYDAITGGHQDGTPSEG